MGKEYRQEVEDRLLGIGLRHFAENGYSGTTFRDICEEADCNIAAINYYFGDKAGFYMAVRKQAVNEMTRKLEMIWEEVERDPWSALRMHIDMHLDAAFNDRMFEINWMQLRELIAPDSFPKMLETEERQAQRKVYLEHITYFLGSLLGEQACTPENIEMLKYMYRSFCLFVPLQKKIEEVFKRENGPSGSPIQLEKQQLADFIYNVVEQAVGRMRKKAEEENK